MTVLSEITERFEDFSPVNQTLARYILEHTGDFLTQTAIEIGRAAGVSAASVTRFARMMGFDGLQAIKIALARQNAQTAERPLATLVRDDDSVPDIALKLGHSIAQTTRNLQQGLDFNLVATAINLVKHARRIYLEGVGASALAAQDLYLKLLRANRDVLIDQDVHTALERAYYTRADDVVIVYSYSGQTKEVLMIARAAAKNETPIIAITRQLPSPLISLATVTLGLPNTEQLLRIGAVTSLYAESFVGNLLFLGSVQRQIKRMEANYRETSNLVNQLKEREPDDKGSQD